MQFSTIALTAITATLTSAAQTLTLKTLLAKDSTDSYLSSIHEGAGINYVFAGGSGEKYSYDQYQGIIYKELTSGDTTYNMTLSVIDSKSTFPQLQLSVEAPNVGWWLGDDNELNGLLGGYDVTFYAGKNTNDPYGYSKNSFAIGATGEAISTYGVQQVESLQVIKVYADVDSTC